MRYIIINKKSKKLLTINTYQTIEDCMKEVTNKVKYWKKQCKNKEIPKTRLKSWKSSVFLCLNWESEVYGDLNMSYNQQTNKCKNNSKLSTILETHKQQGITNTINKQISNENRRTYAG